MKKQQLGLIGLGKMGQAIVKRLQNSNIQVVGFDPNVKSRNMAEKNGAVTVNSVGELIKSLKKNRVIWVMVPSGPITDKVLNNLGRKLQKGDIVIDGGNSNYEMTQKRAEKLAKKGMAMLDCGTSGGVSGAEIGFSLMVGGNKNAFKKTEKIFKTLAANDGYGYFGEAGAGHYVKMIHNGVEYAIMQAIGEGMALLKSCEYDLKQADLARVARVWSNGSVIRSWLMELTESALKDKGFAKVEDYIDDLGEGRWTANLAMQTKTSAPLITLSVIERDASKLSENFAHKIVASLREQFGGKRVRGKN